MPFNTPRQVATLTIIGALTLAILEAHDLPGWADQLPENSVTLAFADGARAWDVKMQDWGLGAPYERLRAAVRRVQGLQFGKDDTP